MKQKKLKKRNPIAALLNLPQLRKKIIKSKKTVQSKSGESKTAEAKSQSGSVETKEYLLIQKWQR